MALQAADAMAFLPRPLTPTPTLALSPSPSPKPNPMPSQVADAMAHLHAQSPPIVHRDLKSHNVLLDYEGRCRYDAACGILPAAHSLRYTACGILTTMGCLNLPWLHSP